MEEANKTEMKAGGLFQHGLPQKRPSPGAAGIMTSRTDRRQKTSPQAFPATDGEGNSGKK